MGCSDVDVCSLTHLLRHFQGPVEPIPRQAFVRPLSRKCRTRLTTAAGQSAPLAAGRCGQTSPARGQRAERPSAATSERTLSRSSDRIVPSPRICIDRKAFRAFARRWSRRIAPAPRIWLPNKLAYVCLASTAFVRLSDYSAHKPESVSIVTNVWFWPVRDDGDDRRTDMMKHNRISAPLTTEAV
jgi:hypothetical protein